MPNFPFYHIIEFTDAFGHKRTHHYCEYLEIRRDGVISYFCENLPRWANCQTVNEVKITIANDNLWQPAVKMYY